MLLRTQRGDVGACRSRFRPWVNARESWEKRRVARKTAVVRTIRHASQMPLTVGDFAQYRTRRKHRVVVPVVCCRNRNSIAFSTNARCRRPVPKLLREYIWMCTQKTVYKPGFLWCLQDIADQVRDASPLCGSVKLPGALRAFKPKKHMTARCESSAQIGKLRPLALLRRSAQMCPKPQGIRCWQCIRAGNASHGI